MASVIAAATSTVMAAPTASVRDKLNMVAIPARWASISPAERWIRTTDNQGLAQFIQINGMEYDQYGNPTIINAIGSLNVDMDLDDGPDEASLCRTLTTRSRTTHLCRSP